MGDRKQHKGLNGVRRALLGGMIAAGALWATQATATVKYPVKPITMISPFSAGGGTDFIARMLAQSLSEALGQTVVVENKPGANGMIGSDYVAKSAPDGYTLLMGTVGTHGINNAVYDNVPYDAVKDFRPITLLGRTPMLVLAHPSVKAANIRELIEEARTSAKPMIFSSAGIGSVGHVAGELFAKEANVPLVHAPYRGAAPAAVDLAGGQVPLMFGTPVSTMSYVQAGKVKVLGVTSAQRSTLVPDIPTLNEQGFKGFDVSTWYGLFAPAGTPDEIVNLLAEKTIAFLSTPRARELFLQQGLETVGNTPEEFRSLIESEVRKWSTIKLTK